MNNGSKQRNLLPFLLQRESGTLRCSGRQISSIRNAGSYLAEEKATIPNVNKACVLKGPSRSAFLVAFNHDMTNLASSHGDHSIRILNIKSGECTNILRGHPRTPWTLLFHPSNNDIVASGCLAGEVRIWDLRGGGSEKWRISDEYGQGNISSLAFHPSDHVVLIAFRNHLFFWDWSKPKPFAQTSCNETQKIRWCKFDPWGHFIYTGISNPDNDIETVNSRYSNVCRQFDLLSRETEALRNISEPTDLFGPAEENPLDFAPPDELPISQPIPVLLQPEPPHLTEPFRRIPTFPRVPLFGANNSSDSPRQQPFLRREFLSRSPWRLPGVPRDDDEDEPISDERALSQAGAAGQGPGNSPLAQLEDSHGNGPFEIFLQDISSPWHQSQHPTSSSSQEAAQASPPVTRPSREQLLARHRPNFIPAPPPYRRTLGVNSRLGQVIADTLSESQDRNTRAEEREAYRQMVSDSRASVITSWPSLLRQREQAAGSREGQNAGSNEGTNERASRAQPYTRAFDRRAHLRSLTRAARLRAARLRELARSDALEASSEEMDWQVPAVNQMASSEHLSGDPPAPLAPPLRGARSTDHALQRTRSADSEPLQFLRNSDMRPRRPTPLRPLLSAARRPTLLEPDPVPYFPDPRDLSSSTSSDDMDPPPFRLFNPWSYDGFRRRRLSRRNEARDEPANRRRAWHIDEADDDEDGDRSRSPELPARNAQGSGADPPAFMPALPYLTPREVLDRFMDIPPRFTSSREERMSSTMYHIPPCQHAMITYRIQRWDFTQLQLPDLNDTETNVIVRKCKLHNDATVDISADGRLLATFTASSANSNEDMVLTVVSLEPETFGQQLFSKHFRNNAVSVSISPLNNYVLVGLAAKRYSPIFMPKQIVAQVYKLSKKGAGEDSMEHVSELLHKFEPELRPISVNSARWLPMVGGGVVYCTNRGDIHICRPGWEPTSHGGEMDGEDWNNLGSGAAGNQSPAPSVRRTASTQTDGRSN